MTFSTQTVSSISRLVLTKYHYNSTHNYLETKSLLKLFLAVLKAYPTSSSIDHFYTRQQACDKNVQTVYLLIYE